MKNFFHSADASLNRQLKEARRLSALIETELQKYESLSRANYAHVGDIVYVKERMTEALEFLTETEYIPLEEWCKDETYTKAEGK